ncbi:MAG: HDIG domain-containing protein [bacterium]|nr:HDIG domain-containing protein [bacterium]
MSSALTILQQNLTAQNMLKHCLASGAVMRALAAKLGGNLEDWELAGLLHDADAEKTPPEKQGVTAGEWLRADAELAAKVADLEAVVHAMAAHNQEKTGVAAESKMDWALVAGETLTGLIVASTLVLPSKKLADVTPEMVLRRFKEKSFAKGAKRENILECAKLGLSLEEFVTISLTAMQGIAADLGL